MSRFKSNHLFSSRSCKKPEKCEVLFTLYDFMIMCFHFMIICLLLLPPQSLSFLNRKYICVFYLQYFSLAWRELCRHQILPLGHPQRQQHYILLLFSQYSHTFCYTYWRIQHKSSMKLQTCARALHWYFTYHLHLFHVYSTYTLLLLYLCFYFLLLQFDGCCLKMDKRLFFSFM